MQARACIVIFTMHLAALFVGALSSMFAIAVFGLMYERLEHAHKEGNWLLAYLFLAFALIGAGVAVWLTTL
jgi:hypothetical protein